MILNYYPGLKDFINLLIIFKTDSKSFTFTE